MMTIWMMMTMTTQATQAAPTDAGKPTRSLKLQIEHEAYLIFDIFLHGQNLLLVS